MVTSRPLLDELARVLQYPKLASLFEDPLRTVLLIERASVVVEPTVQVDLLDDEPDNRVLEVDFIVTGDAALLDLGTCDGIAIGSWLRSGRCPRSDPPPPDRPVLTDQRSCT